MRICAALFAVLFVSACFSEKEPTINTRQRSSPALRTFGSCSALAAELRANLAEEMRVQLLQSNDYYHGPLADAESANGSEAGGGRQEGVDFSGTNNQEGGVDEADFVKTDGYHIYLLNGNRLEIMGVPEFGELTQVSSTELEGYPQQMLFDGDRMVVYSSIYASQLPMEHPLRVLVGAQTESNGWWYRSQVLTKVTVLDMSDRTAPTVLRELYLEGYYKTARKVESSVRMVSYAWMDIPGLQYWPDLPRDYYELPYDSPLREEMWEDAANATIRYNNALISNTPLKDFVPQIYERFPSGAIAEHSFFNNSCQDFSVAEDGVSRGFASIFSMDLLGPQFVYDADHIVSTWPHVYASTDTLILAEPAQDWWWYWRNDSFDEASNIHRFDISVPGKTAYTGSGRVAGMIRNQFGLSEHNDNIRVAATTGQWRRWWMEDPDPPENHVYVLRGADSLEIIGQIGGIAVGEQIWASRFVGDRGYLVTFRNIDPLWTIDLSDPTAPVIMGELEIPGVSTYIHPLGDNHLLTIGYGGDENGLDWATQVSLFNISDFSDPQLQSALSLAPEVEGDDWTYAWSEATWEHKAFQYWGPMDMLAIPLTTYRHIHEDGHCHYDYVSRLQLINVSTQTGLSTYADVDHSDFFPGDETHWYNWLDVRRSIFMGDFIYAISDKGVTATRISDMRLSASVELGGHIYDPYWYW